MRSRWLSMPLLLLVGFFFRNGSGFSLRARNLKKSKLGVPAISMGNIIIFFTKEAKLFEKHGLDAQTVVDVRAPVLPPGLWWQAAYTISPITTPAVMSAVLAGSDMVILAHTMPGVIQSLMVRPEIKRTRGSQRKNDWGDNLRLPRGFSGALSR